VLPRPRQLAEPDPLPALQREDVAANAARADPTGVDQAITVVGQGTGGSRLGQCRSGGPLAGHGIEHVHVGRWLPRGEIAADEIQDRAVGRHGRVVNRRRQRRAVGPAAAGRIEDREGIGHRAVRVEATGEPESTVVHGRCHLEPRERRLAGIAPTGGRDRGARQRRSHRFRRAERLISDDPGDDANENGQPDRRQQEPGAPRHSASVRSSA
jgi:hypothetical protein